MILLPTDRLSSDLHLDHAKVIEFSKRPFTNLEEMQEKMLAEINAIPDGCRFITLGDFVITNKAGRLQPYLEAIKPTLKQVFTPGNHDHRLVRMFEKFGEVHDRIEAKYNNIKIVMQHYPMYEWNRGDKGSLHFHGHTHGHFKAPGKILDVCWDAHGRILTIEEAFALADANPIYQPCHSRNNGKTRETMT